MKDYKKVFIPLTLDNSTKTLFSGKQLVGFLLFTAALIILQLLMIYLRTEVFYSSTGAIIVLFIDIVCIYFLVFLLRKIVLKENEMLQQYRDNLDLQKTDISFCWDIYSIRDGRIYYCNGSQGVIIRLTHGYLLDRPADQQDIHRDTVKIALGQLAKQGYKFIYFNRETRDPNLGPLRVTEHNLYKYKNTTIYSIANQIIQHTYRKCNSVANTEQEYYLILADNINTIRKIDHVAKDFIRSLQGGIYVKREVLNTQDVWEFISSLYGINYIDTSALLSKKFESAKVQLVQVIDVSRDETPATQSVQENLEPDVDPNWSFMQEDTKIVSNQSIVNQGDDDLLI